MQLEACCGCSFDDPDHWLFSDETFTVQSNTKQLELENNQPKENCVSILFSSKPVLPLEILTHWSRLARAALLRELQVIHAFVFKAWL